MKTHSNKKPSNSSIHNTLFLNRKGINNTAEKTGEQSHFFSNNPVRFGKHNDSFEKEADSASDRVVSKNETQKQQGNIGSTTNTIAPAIATKQVQAKSFFPESPTNAEIQMKEGDTGDADSADFENNLSKTSHSGRPMDNSIKNEMESGFGKNFSHVNIHTGSEAESLSNSIGARAFTHGKDIYFNKNQYQPGNKEGKHLIAHELTHTIQQGHTKTPSVQKADDATTAVNASPVLKVEKGKYAGTELDVKQKTFKITQISLPYFKKRNNSLFKAPIQIRKGKRSQTNQVENWKTAVTTGVTTKVDNKVIEATNSGGVTPEGIYFFKAKHKNFYLFGTKDELIEKAKIPFWDDTVNPKTFQVDHIVEDQLSGPDDKNNYELLDATANMSSGSNLAKQIIKRMSEALTALKNANKKDTRVPEPKSYSSFKNQYSVSFLNFDYNLRGIAGEPNRYWSLSNIMDGVHLKKLVPLRGDQLPKIGKKNNALIFTSQAGGAPLSIPARGHKVNWMPRVDLLSWEPSENIDPNAEMGTLTLNVYKAAAGREIAKQRKNKERITVKPSYAEQKWRVKKINGIYGGYIAKEDLEKVKNSLRLPGLSDIILSSIDIDPIKGIIAKGKVKTTIPLIDNADIDIEIIGSDIYVRKVFDTGEIKVPSPFKITNSSLEVYISSTDFGGSGEVQFEIEKIGSGFVKAAINSDKGFLLDGEFNFDFKQLNPATIKVLYENGEWNISATLGIQKGVIKGVKDATITISYVNKVLLVMGTVNLDIPKVKNGILMVSWSKKEGLIIDGTFALDDSVKGVKNSIFHARITRKPGEDAFKVAADGTVFADIPGLQTTSITGSYDDGLFSLQLNTGYKIGIVSGTLHVGVTNQEMDEEGKPTGKESEEPIFWGGATLEVVFADMVKGTVEGQVTPIGEVILKGGISLANEIPLTKKAFEIKPKPLFEFPTISIPIGPSLSVLGKKIGIFLEFGGSLNFEAGIGPLMLKKLYLNLEGFNPQKPENVKLTGGAALSLPAYAQLKLILFAGVSLSVLIVEAWGRLNGSAALILQGEAGGDVEVEWSRETGLKLVKASGHLDAAVKLLLSVFLSAGVEVDLLLTSFTAWSDKWDLASLEIGTPLSFGIDFPVEMENGNVKGIDFSNMKLNKPSFDSSSLKKILSDAVDIAQNPPPGPPPSKEAVIKKLRKLEPGYSFDIFGDNDSGRWGYVLKLQIKYPDQDWQFAKDEAKRIDQSEVEPLKSKIQGLPCETNFEKMIIMGKVTSFKDDRPYVNLSSLKPILKEKGIPEIV